jgi:putative sterol carrier protein
MNVQQFSDRVRHIVAAKDNLNYTAKFVFDEGVVFLDGTVRPNVVVEEDKPADCTIEMSLKDALDFLNGQLNPTMAFMMGRMRVDGKMGVALKIAEMVKN